MNRVRLSSAEADDLLLRHESHFLDLKSASISAVSLSKTVSAFANTSGGEVFVGVEDHSVTGDRWNGLGKEEDANGIFQVLEQLVPGRKIYSAEFLEAAERSGLVLHLLVPKCPEIVPATDGIPRIRRNAQNLQVTGEALDRLKYEKGIVSYEDEIVNVDPLVVTNSVEVLEFMVAQVPSGEPDVWLTSQQVLIERKPTVAGVLLFSDLPQAALPKRSAVKVYRYATTEETLSRDMLTGDPLTVEGPIYDVIYESVATVKSIIESIKRMTEEGLEDVVYPEETLHEIITNAVLHRDYSVATDTQIRIYDDRVEIESPGRFPGHVSVQNFLDEQFARNPKLVRLINKFPDPPNKDVGEGFNTAFEAMRKIRLKDPEVIERENSVLVVVRHARLASPAQIVMEYLESHDTITNVIGREITGIRRDVQMKDILVALRNRGLIEIVPGTRGRATAWRKKGAGGAQTPIAPEEPGIPGLFADVPPPTSNSGDEFR
jgi:ATP-dependent DNA helicase RecG